jgi:hypothetical protein
LAASHLIDSRGWASGARAGETVRDNFLMSRLVEDWIEVLSVLERRLAQ